MTESPKRSTLAEGLMARGKAEEKKWDQFKDQEYPNVFSHLSLAEDGGFSEVKDLYNHMRWVSAAVLVLFVVYNMFSLISMDISFITDADAQVKSLGGTAKDVLKPFYLSRDISNKIGATINGDPDFTIEPVRVLGAFELLGVSLYFIAIVIGLVYWATNTGFWRWYFCMKVCWDWMPDLSSFSAMKLLNDIVPAVFMAKFFEKMAFVTEAESTGRKVSKILQMVFWLVYVILAFIIGFDTFLMKLRVVAIKAGDVNASPHVIVPCMQFLIQVLGVVQLGPFVRKRLFVFIFGGEDGILQEDELELMDTWQALLARRMYRDLSLSNFMAVMLSFSDEDFQSLVLNENAEKKEETVGTTLSHGAQKNV